jgi:hypothetical protein
LKRLREDSQNIVAQGLRIVLFMPIRLPPKLMIPLIVTTGNE